MIKYTAALLFLFSLVYTDTFGQHQFLVLHKAVSSEISPQKSDSFYVKMQKNQFASLRVTEKNVRLFVEVFDPSDSLIMIVDENQMGNKEVVSFFSKASGNYKIKAMW